MSLLKIGSHSRRSWFNAPLLAAVAMLLLCLDAGAAAHSVSPGEAALPVVQVTKDQADDFVPALELTADGKLLAVFVRHGGLWSAISMDGGATWRDVTQVTGCCRNNPSLARAASGALWLVYERESDIWRTTSIDGGTTWSAEQQLTTDSSYDDSPVIFQASGGNLWVVWHSHRTGNLALWYKTSADGGVHWSVDAQLSTGSTGDYTPAAAAAADGRLVVTWNRGDALWQRSSTDAGVTWSVERQIVARGYNPSLAAAGGVLWLAYELDGDIWYRSSANQGDNWSAATSFTRFVGNDGSATLAALADGKPGLAWHSGRSGNTDIWFGSPSGREDINPPPYIDWMDRQPQCNPDSDDPLTFRAYAQDETGVTGVSLLWTLDGAAQADEPLFDDGTRGDAEAGDGIWTAQRAPLPGGSQVIYRARAMDTDGNTYLYPGEGSFKVARPFVKTTGILFVPDSGGGSDTAWFRSYYSVAMDDLGYTYDTWDVGLRCEPDSMILKQYTDGIVIWAVPHWGCATDAGSGCRGELQAYLAAGGKLLISGQNIAEQLSWGGSAGFLNDYLHATLRREDTGLYALTGAAGDAIGDELVLNISGGDGANNQYSKDEIDPIAPAEAAFTYRTGASAMLAWPVRSAEEPPGAPPRPDAPATPAVTPTALPQPTPATPAPPATPTPAITPAACAGSCTAGLHVDTGVYRVVYLAFGFEGINQATHRAGVMERALAWLQARPPQPIQLVPTRGQAVPAGDVLFSWLGVPGAARYEIQIDVVPTFDSPDLIDETEGTTSHIQVLATLGTRCWRVRALLEGGWGDWTAAREFSITAGVVQVTANQADDASPALVQTADGKLLAVFVRNGGLWSRAGTDGGATWAAETQLAGCCRYNPSLARDADGTLWLAYDHDAAIWLRTSADHGATWTTERQLTSDPTSNPEGDTDPVVFEAADGRLWVVWQSNRPSLYNASIWYKTSANRGATWSSEIQLTRDARDTTPAIAQAAGGRLVVVWNRYNWLFQSSTTDGGDTWSDPKQIADVGRLRPSLAAVDGVLWLVHEWGDDIWYRTSQDQGETWSGEVLFTRFVGGDCAPAAAALAAGSVGIAWQSDRSGNPDIWFGSPDERKDLDPPPYVFMVDHQPWPNPENDDIITFRAYVKDETGVAGVHLMWTLDGVAQDDLSMFDDGAHDDAAAGDGVWGIQHGPLPEGSLVTYRAIATDVDGNSYRYPGQKSFKVLPEFVKTAAILLVADAGGNNIPPDTAWFRPYYTRAMEALGYRYDIWDTELRGQPGSAILMQYTPGAVIWAVPYSGYVTDSRFESVLHLQAYLDAGGRLFLTGQNVAQSQLNWYGEDFLKDYLHATFRQEDTNLYALAGAAGDPIGGGLALNLSGGDGANNQYSKDEIDPIAPAEVIFTYRTGASAMLAEPVPPAEAAPAVPLDASRQPEPDAPATPAASAASAPVGNVGSGTAGLRVDTGTYKVVYFAFGFEAINQEADRTAVMGRVLTWLGVPRLTGLYLPLVFAVRG